MTDLVILGAGGHARVLVSALQSQGLTPAGCVSPKPPDAHWPHDIPHLGGDEHLATLDAANVQLVNGVGSVGSTAARAELYGRLAARGFRFTAVIHPSALIAKDAILGDGAQVMAGAVIQTGAVIGANVLVNTGAVIDHDCRIGAHCHIATGACLSGAVVLGTGVHVGTGACVIQSIRVGDRTLIGAGAVVLRDLAADVTAVGNPARALPRRTETC